MSRTDKDIPNWVRAMRAAQAGAETMEFHSAHCAEDRGCDFRVRKVPRADAEANGWPEAPEWGFRSTSTRAYVRVPHGPFPCDIDTGASECRRYYSEPGHRWIYTSPPSREDRRAYYFGPERAHVRATLHTAAKEWRATGDVDTEPLNRQTRSSDWRGGWWD